MMVEYFPLPEYDATGGRVIVTSPYGPRWGRLHAGVDLGTTDGIEVGTPVYAPEDGKITGTGYNPNANTEGRWMWLVGDTGLWKFFHLSGFQAVQGQAVTAGQAIAYVGATGTSAAHLHLELWQGGHSLDPYPYIEGKPFVGEKRPEPEVDWFDTVDEATLRRIVREEADAAVAESEWAHVVQQFQLQGHGAEAPTLRDVVERTYNGVKTLVADPKVMD